MPDEQQPGRGDEAQRGGGGRSPAAARVGLAATLVLGVAVAAGIGGLSLLANTGLSNTGLSNTGLSNTGGRHGSAHGTRVDAASVMPVTGTALRVVSVLPSAKSRAISGDSNVQIAFSANLAQTSAVPTFRPAVAGHWLASGNLLSFTPSVPFTAATRYTLVIPAGKWGLRSASGGAIAKAVLVTFRTGGYSQLRLAEVLSQLGYLPLSWQPAESRHALGGQATGGVVGQEQMAYSPPVGSFTWSSGYPASLRARWRPGQPNVVVRGAVIAFQAQHKLAVNGKLSEKFWHALFVAAATSQRSTIGYSYAIADKGSPETLTIWHNGRQVLRSLANTGIPVAPTVSGTFPVFRRFRYQIMSGTNPDGSHYADPVTFVSYFNGADAVHYFPRGSYGSPQSLGCIELPYNEAQRAWPYLTYGSLITVTG